MVNKKKAEDVVNKINDELKVISGAHFVLQPVKLINKFIIVIYQVFADYQREYLLKAMFDVAGLKILSRQARISY